MATGSLQVNRDIIIATKKQHLNQQMKQTPPDAILALAQMQDRPRSILNYSHDSEKIILIAQITRQTIYDPVTSALHCLVNGADAIAFFTDHSIYHDDLDDMLLLGRALPNIPVICQNYMMNEYSVMAARASGASSVFSYSSIIEQQALRKVVSMTQRWKMSTILQIANDHDLDYALSLSPHALAFGDNLSENLGENAEYLAAVHEHLPSHYNVLLSQTLHSIDEVQVAVDAGVDAVIVDETLMKHQPSAEKIKTLITQAETNRQRAH